MEMYGARVVPSPSNLTNLGRELKRKRERGSIATASDEVREFVKEHRDSFKISGSFCDYALTYNSIVGLEASKQLKYETGSKYPDSVMCCIGGGSALGGISAPFIDCKDTEIIAVESKSVPKLTLGKYDYFPLGSISDQKPKMYSLGYDFKTPKIYGAGLTSPAASPLLSYFVKIGRIKAVAIDEIQARRAAQLLGKLERIIVAPESAFTIAAIIEEAKNNSHCKTVLSCITGNGILDIKWAYRLHA
jgi:tryptophan synthase beta chain